MLSRHPLQLVQPALDLQNAQPRGRKIVEILYVRFDFLGEGADHPIFTFTTSKAPHHTPIQGIPRLRGAPRQIATHSTHIIARLQDTSQLDNSTRHSTAHYAASASITIRNKPLQPEPRLHSAPRRRIYTPRLYSELPSISFCKPSGSKPMGKSIFLARACV